MIHEAWLWLGAVFGQWQNWLSGSGVGGAVVIVIGLLQWFGVWKMPKGIYALVFLGCFFVGANFVAWKNQHEKLLALEIRLASPEFKLRTDVCAWMSYDDKLAIIQTGVLSNPLGPPSGVSEWSMTFEAPGRGTYIGGLMPPPSSTGVFTLPNKNRVLLRPDLQWQTNALKALNPGDAVEGWIMGVFPGATVRDAEIDGARVITTFKDVATGKEHVTIYNINAKVHGLYVPGFSMQNEK